MTNCVEDILNDVFLLENQSPKAFNWSTTSSNILRAIGNPSIARADDNAATAMGVRARARRGGTDVETPAARILWNAGVLHGMSVASPPEAAGIASYARVNDELNPSQENAVARAAEKALTLIWGPPGTGKTKTLSAAIHSFVAQANKNNEPLKILVTGPTYKAVEELMHRTANYVSSDLSAHCSMYMAYSKRRAHGIIPSNLSSHVTYETLALDDADATYQACHDAILSTDRIVIIGCQIRQAWRFPQSTGGCVVSPVFDIVILDESSQTPVSYSISAFAGLKETSRAIIAGDPLQMPPITTLEPPVGAKYLVGSIQTYLCERDFSQTIQQCVLETNYRSNSTIVDFAKSIGYPATLHAFHEDRRLCFLEELPNKASFPVNFPWLESYELLLAPENAIITVLHEDQISSQGNIVEAKMVAGMVWMLRSVVAEGLSDQEDTNTRLPDAEKFWKTCVGIVTPHRAQRALVVKQLEDIFPANERDYINDAVDTVERFQGGERHTIIVTYGVGDTDVISGEEAFLMQLERTNVAVSRAMAKCIVIMPQSLASHIPEDKRAIKTAFALKDYVEDFCNIRVESTIEIDGSAIPAQVRYREQYQ